MSPPSYRAAPPHYAGCYRIDPAVGSYRGGMSSASEQGPVRSRRSYVIGVSVDAEDITPEQYNQLCEHLCDQTADFFGPDVDIMISGHVETFTDEPA